MLSFKSTFSFSSFTFIKRPFSSSSLSAIRVVSSVRVTSEFVTVGGRGGSEVEGRLETPCVPSGKMKRSLGWRELANGLREGNPKCPRPSMKLVDLESFRRSSALTPYSSSSLLPCILEAPQNEKLDFLALQPLTHSLICFEHIKLIQHIRL